jgi:hypothetical protein
MRNDVTTMRLLQSRAPALLGFVVASCAHVGLNTGGTPTTFNIVVQSITDNTKNHPSNSSFSVSAVCAVGQQLVGGGYRLVNNSNAQPTQVAIEGNFPSASNTWTVQARNPDNAGYSGDADVVVIALAYCVTTPNLDLGTEIIQSSPTTIPQSATASPGFDIEVRCSKSTSLVLSGGFRTTSLPVYNEPGGGATLAFWPGLQGSGITSSVPKLRDPSNSAMGWHVTQQYTPALHPTAPQATVTTTIFAICAQRSINEQAARIAAASGVLSAGVSLDALCQVGEFTVGGGYQHMTIGLPFGSSGVSETYDNLAIHSPFLFDGWEISGSSSGSPIDALALCVRIPII